MTIAPVKTISTQYVPAIWVLMLTLLLIFGSMLPAWKFFSAPSDYLPLHTVLEFASMTISAMLFLLAWSLRNTRNNSHLFVLGAGFLAVCLIDLAHALSYSGMPALITPSGAEKAINFWLAGRYATAGIMLYIALTQVRSWPAMARHIALLGFLAFAGVVWWLVIGHAAWLPRTFIPGQGLTAFKIGSEYLLGLLYATAAILLFRQSRETCDPSLRWLSAAAWVLGLAEMFFTLYADVTDLFNLLGHVYKAIAYLMIYRAIFETYVRAPYAELDQERSELRKFSLAVEQSPESIVITNLDGKIEYVNQTFIRKTGYSREEAIGKNPRVLQSGKTPPEVYQGLWDSLNRGLIWRGEFTNKKKDGTEYVEKAQIAPIRQPDGQITNYLAIKEDITEHKANEAELNTYRENLETLVAERTAELAHNEARTRSILKTMADGVVQINSQGTILAINDAVLELFAYEEHELIGQNVKILMPEPYHSEHDDYLQRYQASRSSKIIGKRVEVSGKRKDGFIFPLELVVNEVPDDSGSTYIGVLHDITQRKVAEQQLLKAKEAAETAARTKSDFLANMSHEIRTPLNAVLGLAQIGLRDSAGRKSGETFRRITDAGEHLLALINDILDISRLDAGRLKVETHPFALASVLDSVISLVANRAEAKGLLLVPRLAPDLPPWVAGDALRLSQILTNLLSNSIKFTHGGEIFLCVACEGDKIFFRVTDSGIGMNEEQMGRLFKAFEQADASTTREYGGSGLGLAISRNLANLMGGDIHVESSPGAGSSFTLQLHMAASNAPEHPAGTPSASAAPRLTGFSVLAADDVEINRLILEDLLVHEGAHVVFATNGKQAIERLEEAGASAFDIVLMDIQMPVMDGFAATRRIREMAPALPVIGLTAHALSEEREKCLAAGMVEHVTKPININLLVNAILHHAQPAAPHQPAIQKTQADGKVPEEVNHVQENSQIDWTALHARYQERPIFIEKLARTMIDSHAQTPARLRSMAAQKDLPAIAFIAHNLKGLGGSLMASNMQKLATAAEAAARKGEADAFDLTEELSAAMQKLLDELAAHYPLQDKTNHISE